MRSGKLLHIRHTTSCCYSSAILNRKTIQFIATAIYFLSYTNSYLSKTTLATAPAAEKTKAASLSANRFFFINLYFILLFYTVATRAARACRGARSGSQKSSSSQRPIHGFLPVCRTCACYHLHARPGVAGRYQNRTTEK